MTKRIKDVFAFSLGGYPSALPFAAMPVVADNRLNNAISKRIENDKAGRGRTPRLSGAAHSACPQCGAA